MEFLDKDLILPAIFSALSGLFGWIIGRKKENVEIQGSAIDNVDKAVKLWQDTAEKMSQRVDELSEKVDALTQEVHSLRSENTDLKHKLGLDVIKKIKAIKSE